jgi:hypothetical protein
VTAAWNAGGIVVAASGNSGASTPLYPANYANVIAVGANDNTGARWTSSNYGANLDVMAPGVAVVSTIMGGGYGAGTGTSFAAPHASGVVALMISAGITDKNAIVSRLTGTATDMGGAGFDNLTGWGRINAAAALDNAGPTAAITAPSNGATLSGASVDFTATASDPAGVNKVRFWVDSTYLGFDQTAPYGKVWDTTASSNGSHTLKVEAFDQLGNITTTTIGVTVDNTDNTPPLVDLTAPSDGADVSGAPILVRATASDVNGINKVQFWLNGSYLGFDQSAPYARQLDPTLFPNGAYTLKAIAFDNSGNSAQDTISITISGNAVDTTGPTASITGPSDGATVSGSSVAFTATASDPSGVNKVRFWVDGTYLGFDQTAPYAKTWDTTTTYNGVHTLKIEAFDSLGNLTVQTISVTVDNADATPPTAGIAAPLDGATVSGTVSITATASDDLGVNKVRFWVDGTYLGYDSTAPYTRSWDSTSVGNGTHTIRVQAVDNAGNVSSDATISVTVNN